MARQRPGRAMWLAPDRFAVDSVVRLLLARMPGGCFSPNVLTFEQFSERVLASSPTPVRPVSAAQRRYLVRQIVQRLATAGELPYLTRAAESAGLVDTIVAQMREFKRLEIWPDEFEAACASRKSPKDLELARVYRDYQDILSKHHLYDAEGRFWSARTLLSEGHRSSVKSMQLLVVDGFTDFTRPQHEMLESLAEEVDEMIISLLMDEEGTALPVRRDLFSKTLATLERLKRGHVGLRVVQVAESLGAPRSGSANRTYTASHSRVCDAIFRPPDVKLPPLRTGDLEVWQVVSPLREAEEIARDIKRLLLSGAVRAEDVVVVCRSLANDAPLIEEAFTEYGVPASIDVRRPIESVAFMRNLLLLLRLDQGDWRYDDVLAVIRNYTIRWTTLPAGGGVGDVDRGVRRAAERVVRRQQIPAGRASLLAQFRRVAEALDREDAESRDSSDTAAALARLDGLAAYLDCLPKEAKPAAWAEIVFGAFKLCGRDAAADDKDPAAGADELARDRVVEALHRVDNLAQRVGSSAIPLSRKHFQELLADLAAHEYLPQSAQTAGRVRVLPAISARGIQARHLYFAGLTEHAMPQPASEQAYYSPRETARLMRAGLPLVGAQRRYEEEMLLFYEVISRAGERLVLSYAALDEKAQPILASPFLEEVRRVGGANAKVIERLDLRPVDRAAAPLCPREFRTRAVCDAVVDGGDTSRLQTLAAGGGPICDGLSIVAARADREAFGPAEGLVASQEAADALADHFGPGHPWSPTALEQFALCPFQFFMERVLNMEQLEDLELTTDHRRRGRLVHQCLVELFQRLERIETQFLSATVDAAQVQAEMLAWLAPELARLQGGGFVGALEAVDLEQVRKFSETLHLQQQCYDGFNGDLDGPPWPVYFEVRFGPAKGGARDDGEDQRSKEEPYALDLGGERIKLTGRIDRIDIGTVGGQQVFNVIDYKTGAAKSLSAQKIAQGLQLQIPLYAMAVEEHLLAEQGAVAWQADYWWLRESGFGNKGPKARSGPFTLREATSEGLVETAEWRELKAAIKDRVRRIVHSVRRGEFVVFSQDENCTRTCPYSGVCRIGQVRTLEKEWDDASHE